jgi:PPP family 3-phenylpropionic acid transporter
MDLSQVESISKLINMSTFGFDTIWSNFNPIWFTENGFNPQGIGLIRTFGVISLIFIPFWTNFANSIEKKKIFLSLILIGCLGIQWINGSVHVVNESPFYITLMSLLYTIIWIGIRPLHEGLLLFFSKGNKTSFSETAIYGTIGAAISFVIAGYFYTWFGFGACWNLQVLLVVVTLLLILIYIPQDNENQEQEEEEDIPFSIKFNKVLNHLNTPSITKIMVLLVVQGAGSIMIQSFLFGFLHYELKAPLYYCGWVVFVGSISELFIVFYGAALLEKFGINTILIISQIAFIMRTYFYTTLSEETASWILAIEILNGFSYVILWQSVASYTKSICTNNLQSMAVFIMGFFFNQAGSIIGNNLGGFIFRFYGAYKMIGFFCFCSIITFCWFSYRCYLEYKYPHLYHVKSMFDSKEKENINADLL